MVATGGLGCPVEQHRVRRQSRDRGDRGHSHVDGARSPGGTGAAVVARDDRESPAARAAFSTDTWLTLTGDELDQVAQEVQQVFFRWRERTKARSGPGESEEPSGGPRTQVFLYARGFPAQP